MVKATTLLVPVRSFKELVACWFHGFFGAKSAAVDLDMGCSLDQRLETSEGVRYEIGGKRENRVPPVIDGYCT